MPKHESRLKNECHTAYLNGFIECVEGTKEAIINKLKDAIQNGTVVIAKGADNVFEIIDSVGDINK